MNHIGIVVKSIDQYVENSFYYKLEKYVFDSIQHSNLGLILTNDGEPNIELIEPIDENSTTFNFLKKTGGGYHHICYEFASLSSLDSFMNKHRIKKIFGPVKAILFDNKKVVFGITKNREILEFLIMN